MRLIKGEAVFRSGKAEEEADETMFWLELIIAAKWNLNSKAQIHHQEANELTAIIVTLIKKAKYKLKSDGENG